MSEQERDRYEYALKLQWDRNMDEYTMQQIQEESVKTKAELDKANTELNQAKAELMEAQIAMAKALKENGAPIDLIVKSTGLSREAIEAL